MLSILVKQGKPELYNQTNGGIGLQGPVWLFLFVVPRKMHLVQSKVCLVNRYVRHKELFLGH